jgi:hypothetical protein
MAPQQIVVTARRTRSNFRSIVVSLAAICLFGLIVVAGPAKGAPATSSSISNTPATASSSPSYYEVEYYVNGGVQGAYGQIVEPGEYTTQNGQDYFSLSLNDICINETFNCGVGTRVSFEYATFLENGKVGPFSAMSNIAVVKATASPSPIAGLRCTSICAFAVGSGNVVASWPASTAPSKAPHITVEPKSQRVATATYATFKAAASGFPTPSGVWQVSTNRGASWSNIPPSEEVDNTGLELDVAVDAFVNAPGVVIGDAGSFSGYEYRDVFTNVAGSATTRPATLTALTDENTAFAGYTDFAPSALSSAGGFTSASADWAVPAIKCATDIGKTWAAQWPGVGENNNVVQDGTIEGCKGTTVLPDAAWYEMLGDPAVAGGAQVELPIAKYPVAPGDHIAASVRLVHSIWTLAITDSTQDWVFSIRERDTTPPLNEFVAQVFTESSSGEVANFGATNFTAATATLNGHTGPLGAFLPTKVATYSGSTPLDVPSPFDSTGEKFTNTWEGY